MRVKSRAVLLHEALRRVEAERHIREMASRVPPAPSWALWHCELCKVPTDVNVVTIDSILSDPTLFI